MYVCLGMSKALIPLGLIKKKRKKFYGGLHYGLFDAYFVGNLGTSRSMIKFFFIMWGNPVSWKSNLQPMVTLPFMEIE